MGYNIWPSSITTIWILLMRNSRLGSMDRARHHHRDHYHHYHRYRRRRRRRRRRH